MADIPKLTDTQAALMRFFTALHSELGAPDIETGRAALAAYDAEQRRQIRIEAMRECASKAQDLKRTSIGAASYGLLIAIDGIRELIDAEEASNG